MLASRLCLFDWRPVPSRLLLVVAVALFGLVSSCVSCGGVFGVGSLDCGGVAVGRGVMLPMCGQFGDAVSCGGTCGAGRGAGRMARRGRSE